MRAYRLIAVVAVVLVGIGVTLPFFAAPSAEAESRSIEILSEDKPVARVTPAVPEPLEDGSIRYVASAPADKLEPGLSEIRVTVEQAGTAARESLLVTIK